MNGNLAQNGQQLTQRRPSRQLDHSPLEQANNGWSVEETELRVDGLGNISDSDGEESTRVIHQSRHSNNWSSYTQRQNHITSLPERMQLPFGRLRRSWSTIMLTAAVLVLMTYLLFVSSHRRHPDIEDFEIDVALLERELDNANPVQIVTYQPPGADKLWDDKSSKGKKNKLSQADPIYGKALTRTMKYHKIWAWANAVINIHELFPDTPDVDAVLEALATARIVSADVLDIGEYESGTSEKWVVFLEGGQKAMMKMQWEGHRKGQMKKDAQCNFGYEMPHAEIAAFHLHRLMGMRNTPYVTGRKIDLRRDILPVATPAVAKQITLRAGNETCVTGKCFYCDTKHTMCPPDGLVEASLALWVPRRLKLYTYPPKYMPYSTPRMDEWSNLGMNNRTYCNKARQIHPYDIDRYYHDLFDFAVIDTLMYHYDSKHYLIYDHSDAHGLTVRLDHGRAFCASDRDDEHIFLAPIFQCCTIRRPTWWTIETLRNGLLTRRLRQELTKDPLHPVLSEDFFPALERRLQLIINTIERCATVNGGWDNIFVG